MIVLIDNYDSFTYNIYHYILHFKDNVKVVKNTESLEYLKNISNLEALVLSPGPSHPSKSLLTLDAIDFFAGKIPVFGVCLGMQAIGYYFSAEIIRAKTVMHGKTDKVEFKESPIFKGLKNPIEVVRYHSLVVKNPVNLDVVATSSSDNEIMAVENKEIGIFGVQFHPESYLTEKGMNIIKNFLEVVYD